MRISIFAALMAAASLVPGAAMAQRGDQDRLGLDRNPRGVTVESRLAVDRGQPDRAQRPDRPQARQRADRSDGDARGDRGGRGGDSDRRGPGSAQPAPIVAPAPVAQTERGDRSGFRANGGGNRGDAGQWRANGDARNGQWRGGEGRGDNRGGTPQWRGDDNRGGNTRWRGNDRRQDARGDRGTWNRGWRQDNRYDWNRRRQYDRNAFHLPRYYAPSGWNYGYRRFTIGITLNAGLFNRTYWIDDADYYGLPEAYGPYRWVRYYNDALLVDVYSGQVVDTVYDIFW